MAKDGSRATELKALVAEARAKPRGMFPRDLRERLVAYAKGRWEEGASNKALAVELGVNQYTLSYWRARLNVPRKTGAIKRVEVVMPRTSRTLTLRGPHGVWVDGLTLYELAELLRKVS